MKNFDLTGQAFGSLTVLSRHGETGASRWLCRCVCGGEVVCQTSNLRAKRGMACRCATRSAAAARATRHGANRSPEYRAWNDMITRCTNPKSKAYPSYGGRGIVICETWRASFERFAKDMGPLPAPRYTLERNDVNGPYSTANCRWVTRAEQALNKRTNRILSFGGKSMPLASWAREIGLDPDVLERRINASGWDIARALTTPHRGWGPGGRQAGWQPKDRRASSS